MFPRYYLDSDVINIFIQSHIGVLPVAKRIYSLYISWSILVHMNYGIIGSPSQDVYIKWINSYKRSTFLDLFVNTSKISDYSKALVIFHRVNLLLEMGTTLPCGWWLCYLTVWTIGLMWKNEWRTIPIGILKNPVTKIQQWYTPHTVVVFTI